MDGKLAKLAIYLITNNSENQIRKNKFLLDLDRGMPGIFFTNYFFNYPLFSKKTIPKAPRNE
jgi:hypothetical protein